ncbi:MAG: hypothetical protein HYR91_13130 [Flavobacteriia bacterium]|nr:hypothetical protein [Flavobacteriia bacterium]
MEKRIIYTEASIQKFYKHLLMKQQNKVNFEYEIRVDSEKIMPRTKDLTCFYSYRDFITAQTEVVEILLYRGLSRNYEKYVYELSERKTSQIDIDKIVAQELEKYKKEREFIELTKTLEEYKIKNSELKKKIETLEAEAKDGASMKDLIGLFSQSGLLSKITDSKTLNEPLNGNSKEAEKTKKSVLEGYSDEQLIYVLNVYKDKLGDEAFQSLLGSFMQLGENPTIIPIVKQVIEEKLNQK